jgi:hypothetical protein
MMAGSHAVGSQSGPAAWTCGGLELVARLRRGARGAQSPMEASLTSVRESPCPAP